MGGKGEAPGAVHGFQVLQVASHVMPTGQILLIDVEHGNNNFLEEAIDEMNKLGFYYGTMSIGTFGKFDRTVSSEKKGPASLISLKKAKPHFSCLQEITGAMCRPHSQSTQTVMEGLSSGQMKIPIPIGND